MNSHAMIALATMIHMRAQRSSSAVSDPSQSAFNLESDRTTLLGNEQWRVPANDIMNA